MRDNRSPASHQRCRAFFWQKVCVMSCEVCAVIAKCARTSCRSRYAVRSPHPLRATLPPLRGGRDKSCKEHLRRRHIPCFPCGSACLLPRSDGVEMSEARCLSLPRKAWGGRRIVSAAKRCAGWGWFNAFQCGAIRGAQRPTRLAFASHPPHRFAEERDKKHRCSARSRNV